MRRITVVIFLFSLLSCGQDKTAESFSVLQLNVWQEGTMVHNGFSKIVDVIQTVQPSIVTFSEIRNYKGKDWTQQLLTALKSKGIHYEGRFIAGDVGLISQHLIVDHKIIFNETHLDKGSVVAWLININGLKTWVCSGHFDYKHYAVYLPRGYNGGDPNWHMIDDGNGQPQAVTNVDSVLAYNKRSRKDEAIKAFIEFAELQDDFPIIFGMDLNGASHLDWTEKTRNLYGHNNCVIPWNNTLSLDSSGFIDAYRHLFPDEVAYPGITWPAYPHGYKNDVSWIPKADERDRIDYIFYRGKKIKAINSNLVGPRISFAYNKVVGINSMDNFQYDNLPWPSDHMGVFVAFEIQ